MPTRRASLPQRFASSTVNITLTWTDLRHFAAIGFRPRFTPCVSFTMDPVCTVNAAAVKPSDRAKGRVRR